MKKIQTPFHLDDKYLLIMEDLVTFEIAKKLKEKGFPIKTKTEGKFGLTKVKEVEILPTISQVLKWLREEKSFHLMVYILNDSSEDADGRIIQEWFFWSFCVQNCNSGNYAYEGDDVEYESYEQAALAGVNYCLENLI